MAAILEILMNIKQVFSAWLFYIRGIRNRSYLTKPIYE
jgi:hypothetical protein